MAAALLLSSCSEDYDVNTNIYPALAEIGPQGGQLTTTFVSNGLWTATSEDAGISFTPDSGVKETPASSQVAVHNPLETKVVVSWPPWGPISARAG